ncbi:response regulator [Desulfobotulus sp.]|jgi:excisionase family DNA binding protein|uniref:response regulator n=1 Tax=Desulfobotulus sp. TaxID=1940337 RepID=UPI002A369B43|nr:response regulator [Desulfobotulus sp.]MDY0163852.1 response regulator [Desulfobotulus sp.]
MKPSRSFYSIPEAASLCGVSRSTLWSWVKAGSVKAMVTPGGHHRIAPEEVERLLRGEGELPQKSEGVQRVLIVDDDPQMVKILQAKFSRMGIETETARNGFEAGVKVTEMLPDLVMLDLYMPGIDGFEVCRMIKEKKELSGIKVLAMTAFDKGDTEQTLLKMGADACISKSLDMESFMEKVMMVLLSPPRSAVKKIS